MFSHLSYSSVAAGGLRGHSALLSELSPDAGCVLVGGGATTVGVVAWTLVADGWRSLRARQGDDGLRLELRRVIPEDLAADLAPVLAEVAS